MGEALAEPEMDKKIETIQEGGRERVRIVNNGATVSAMRSALEGVLKRRRTKLLVIDEAAHIFGHSKGEALAASVDALKSLGNLTGVTLALVGSYDLYRLVELSAQVSRRTGIVHFGRYGIDSVDDAGAFAKVLEKLQVHMPIEDMPDLSKLAPKLHLACLGCVGILKTTLARALTLALAEGRWRDSHLERALLTEGQLEAILTETLAGEEMVARNLYGTSSFEGISRLFANPKKAPHGSKPRDHK
jgi:hypothetical protein